MVVAVLFIAGLHVPVIAGLLVELIGNAASAAPEHIGATALKVGMMLGVTVIINDVVVAHCPAVGVNV